MTVQDVPPSFTQPFILDMNRRRFVRGAVIAGGGLAAAAVAGCVPAASMAPWACPPAATSARTGASPIVSAANAAGSTALSCRIA